MSAKVDIKYLAMGYVNAEDLNKNNLDLIGSQLHLINIAIKNGCGIDLIKGGLDLLSCYVDDMYNLSTETAKEANDVFNRIYHKKETIKKRESDKKHA